MTKTSNLVNRRNILRLLIIVSIIIGLSSVYQVQALLKVSEFQVTKQTFLTYQQSINATYHATLRPNLLYNMTAIKQGEGPLYQAITETITIKIDHDFLASREFDSENLSSKLDIWIESPGIWNKTFTNVEKDRLFTVAPGPDFTISYNSTAMILLFNNLDDETDSHSVKYNLNLIPSYDIVAVFDEDEIRDTFTPKIIISYVTSSEKGSTISINGLTQSQPRSLDRTVVTLPEFMENPVRIQRWAFFILGLTMSALFLGSSYSYLKLPKNFEGKKEVDLITRKYKSIIVKSSENQSWDKPPVIVDSFQDLLKSAELLSKPILWHESDDQNTFYLIDGTTRYMYNLKK